MANFSYTEYPEILGGAKAERAKISEGLTKLNALMSELFLSKVSKAGSDYESIALDMNTLKNVLADGKKFYSKKRNATSKNQLDDLKIRVEQIYRIGSQVWLKFINANIDTFLPVLNSFNQAEIGNAISNFSAFSNNLLNKTPPELKKESGGKEGKVTLANFLKALNKAFEKSTKETARTVQESSKISAKAHGETKALIESGIIKPEPKKMNLVLPLTIGTGAIAVFFALKG